VAPPDFENLLRELAPQVLSVLIRRYGNFAIAEDALQESLIAAALQWRRDGVPDNPRAWLTTVAGRRMADQVRADAARRKREAATAMEDGYVLPASNRDGSEPDEDEALVLIFMCCHPSLTTSSAIALTLRAVGGLTTAEIARAFLVPEATMAQRISRAKQTIKDSGIPFRMPGRDEMDERLRAVLHVLYLIFNEGYAPSAGEPPQRPDLAREAIRLTRLVLAKLPEDAEVAGLLALMILTDARRPARSGPHGEIIPLDKQDRGLWNRVSIAEGVELVNRAMSRGAVGPYQLQAAVAALHDEAPSTQSTDWPQIAALYSVLSQMTGNPLVILNQAVAVAMVHGPREGLRRIAELETGPLRDHHRLYAVRGHLHELAGDRAPAIQDYQAAALSTASLPERNYLLEQAARLRDAQQTKA
jgi:RNA polymerase sigma factor (sigma-70 family)